MIKNLFAAKTPDRTPLTVIATSKITGLSVIERSYPAHLGGGAEYLLQTAQGAPLNLQYLGCEYRFTESRGQALRWMTELTAEQITALTL